MVIAAAVRRTLLVALIGLWGTQSCPAAKKGTLAAAFDTIRVEDLRRHVGALASDTFEGREAGQRGGKATGAYIGKELRELGIEPGGAETGYFQEFNYGFRNVLGVLPGSDPKLKHEVIVVCAHYDHVGYGTQYNSRGPIGKIHNGADDNASGIAGQLELIEALAGLEPRPQRTILFAFWDAEEKGLLGSRHWVVHPTVSMKRVKLVLNADMIGRVRGGNLLIYGTRTASGLRRLVSQQLSGLALRPNFSWEVLADSDHYPFFKRNVPVLMLHSGKHDDYHRPSDDADKVNYVGVQQVTRLAFRLVLAAARAPQLPRFRRRAAQESKVDRKHAEAALPSAPARLGIAWDDRQPQDGVVRVTAVAPGSAAQQAGLQVGDRILEFSGRATDRWQDFRTLVVTARNPVRVLVKRAGHAESLPLTVHLNGSPTRLGVAWRVDDAEPDCVILRRVIPGSPADLAGLQVNDRVYEANGRVLSDGDTFYQLVAKTKQQLDLVVERRGRIQEIPVQLVRETGDRSAP